MTKTPVAIRQIAVATAGRFVKNFIGLSIRPVSSKYGTKGSLLVLYSTAASASVARTKYSFQLCVSILVISAVSP